MIYFLYEKAVKKVPNKRRELFFSNLIPKIFG